MFFFFMIFWNRFFIGFSVVFSSLRFLLSFVKCLEVFLDQHHIKIFEKFLLNERPFDLATKFSKFRPRKDLD